MSRANLVENLRCGSWTADDVLKLDGRRIRFRCGYRGVVDNAVALVQRGNIIFAYAVEVTPANGRPILLTRAEAEDENNPYCFSVVQDVPDVEERQAILPLREAAD